MEKVERRGGLWSAWGSGMVEMEEGWMWEQGKRYPQLSGHSGIGKGLGSRGVPRRPQQ